MKLLRRYLGSLTFSDNGQDTLDLPRNHVYSALQFLLVADLDREAGSGGTCKDSAPAQLVKNLELVINGKNTLKRMDFETLHRLCQMRHGVRPYIYAHELLGYGALDDDISKVMAQFDFELPRNGPWTKNVDCLLDARGLSDLDLVVTWGTGLDIMDDTCDCASVTVNSAKLFVWTIERVAAPSANYAMWKEWKKTTSVSAAGSLTIDLPTQTTYESLFIKTHSDGDQVDTILPFGLANLNDILLYSGTEQFLRLPAGLLQATNRLDNQIEVPERIGSGAALNHAQQELLLEGYYHVNFVHDGFLTEMLDTSRLSDLKLELDVANPGTDDKVEVIASEIILPAVSPTAA